MIDSECIKSQSKDHVICQLMNVKSKLVTKTSKTSYNNKNEVLEVFALLVTILLQYLLETWSRKQILTIPYTE